jgi:hypothetical protein
VAAKPAGDRARRRRRGDRALGAWATALVLWAASAAPAGAQDGTLEAAIKATYLVKFEPFVDWPPAAFPAADSPVVICALGGDTLVPLLDRATQGQRIGDRPIIVRHLATAASGTSCHILYIGGADATVDQALGVLRGAPVLTVTDRQSGTKGIINFVIRDNRVRFEIDEATASHDGLKISSKLLSLAVAVTPPPT